FPGSIGVTPVPSPFSTEGLAGASARRPWPVLIIWTIVLVMAGIYATQALSSSVSTAITFSNNPDSTVGLQKIDEAELDEEASIGETIVVRSKTGAAVEDQAFQERVTETVGE